MTDSQPPAPRRIAPTELPAPVGPYTHGASFGEMVFCSGQLALDPASSAPLSDLSASEQTRVVLLNLEIVLKAAGSSLAQVAKTTVYLADLSDYEAMNEAYIEYFGEHRPARATVEVKGLIGGLRVEIDAIAVRERATDD